MTESPEQAVRYELRERITGAEFQPGGPLPTEDRICLEYLVSRITVRRALESLQRQGLIERRRGVGSFVAERPGGLFRNLVSAGNRAQAHGARARAAA